MTLRELYRPAGTAGYYPKFRLDDPAQVGDALHAFIREAYDLPHT